MLEFIVKESNVQLENDCFKIYKYLLKKNLAKNDIPQYEFVVNGVKRIVSFDFLDYFIVFNKDLKIKEPFGYFEFLFNKGRTHATGVNYHTAFEYIVDKNTIYKKLKTDTEFTIDKQEQLIVTAYVEKEIIQYCKT